MPRPLTAGQILAKARVAMYLRTYPRYVSYLVDVQSVAFGKHYHEGYRELLRTRDGSLSVHRSPAYTSNQPVNPYGFSFFGINKTGKAPDHIQPPFGVPILSATYDFGLSRPPEPKAQTEQEEEDANRPPVLGRVTVTGGEYMATLLGTETVDGAPAYHLKLEARFDPDRNRVREMWVDQRTYDVRRLVTQGIFPAGPATQVWWTVNFIQLHGYWFIRTESTDATLTATGHLFGGDTTYQGVHYTFGDYAYPSTPDTIFLGQPSDSEAVQM